MNNKTRIFLTQVNCWLPLLAIAMLPIKLSLSYLFIYPAIILSIIIDSRQFRRQLQQVMPLLLPLYLFIGYGLITAILGFDFIGSASELLKLLALTLVIPIFLRSIEHWGLTRSCWVLIGTQSLAALYSLLEARFTGLNYIFLGTVTESGQLAMVVPLALGLYQRKFQELTPKSYFLALTTFAVAIFLAFSGHWQNTGTLQIVAALIFTLSLFINYKTIFAALKKDNFFRANWSLFYFFLPLLAATLLVNLKRGPWLGVFVATSCFLFLKARKLTALVLVMAVLTVLLIAPLRNRLAESANHFSIAGGRQVMWSVAGDLLTRYPLGIGYGSSPVLQKFAREIHAEHKHFHSNYVNIAVEMGYLGFMLFCWWLFRIMRLGFQNWRTSNNPQLLLAATCAFLSWCLAATVEYNFGDSEVLLVAFFIVAIIAKLQEPKPVNS